MPRHNALARRRSKQWGGKIKICRNRGRRQYIHVRVELGGQWGPKRKKQKKNSLGDA